MFTGIVEGMGVIREVSALPEGRRLVIDGGHVVADMSIGDSIAVDGVCLTAVALDGETCTVDVVRETLNRTTLGNREPGDMVDLERPMVADGRFDGHIVQGHVDGVGTVTSIEAEGDSRRVQISMPAPLSRYLVEKGSVTVDGVSLTVAAVDPGGEWFEIALIPHTLDVTVLGRRSTGDRVNLEVDVIAKYVERLLEATR